MSVNSNGILVKQVAKKMKRKQILRAIDVTVQPGETVGIVGCNGSGKTTLLRIMAGIMYADQGEVYVNGSRIRPGLVGNIPTSIGILIEQPSFLPHFSGFDNLYLLAEIRNQLSKQDIKNIMLQVGLDPDDRKKVKSYSLGMRQRLGIAQAVMEQPAVLLLDEPTNGLDEEGLQMFVDVWQAQVQRKAAIVFVSHQKEEIKRYCDKVYQLEEGCLSLLRENKLYRWQLVFENMEMLEQMYQLEPTLQLTERVNGYPACSLAGIWENEAQVIAYLQQHQMVAQEIKELQL